ncbi:hypothetical protein [Chromatium okenii]|uniref:hypothetical protein n=1 Tax=Chromatium okenii TaxID=61644 RepID=UPI001558AE85|nr:hypothetical protein [Chromatium okenii]
MAKLALYFHIIDLASGYLGYSNQNFIQTENVLRELLGVNISKLTHSQCTEWKKMVS